MLPTLVVDLLEQVGIPAFADLIHWMIQIHQAGQTAAGATTPTTPTDAQIIALLQNDTSTAISIGNAFLVSKGKSPIPVSPQPPVVPTAIPHP